MSTKKQTDSQPQLPPVQSYIVCREGIGWSLYRLPIPQEWLQEGERIRDGDSLAGVMAHLRHKIATESQQ